MLPYPAAGSDRLRRLKRSNKENKGRTKLEGDPIMTLVNQTNLVESTTLPQGLYQLTELEMFQLYKKGIIHKDERGYYTYKQEWILGDRPCF
jgi:hypothetical protein